MTEDKNDFKICNQQRPEIWPVLLWANRKDFETQTVPSMRGHSWRWIKANLRICNLDYLSQWKKK